MDIKARLEELYGVSKSDELWNYLIIKHTGGTNNSKGNTYENFFAVYQVAKNFNEKVHEKQTLFSSQAKSFIDDFVVDKTSLDITEWFQLKDVENFSWLDEKHQTIENDFIIQKRLREKDELSIIVSKKELADKLKVTKPVSIADFVNVIHFSTADSINNLVRTNTDFRNELLKMCAISNPATYVLETLAAIVLGAWDSTNKTDISLQALLDKCYQQNPNYIKGFEQRISQLLSNIFNSIKEFSFEIENGFVKWQYGKTDEGIIPYVIGSGAFSQLENNILNLKVPVNFEDLEPYLS